MSADTPRPTPDELKRAYKAFKKKLELSRLPSPTAWIVRTVN